MKKPAGAAGLAEQGMTTNMMLIHAEWPTVHYFSIFCGDKANNYSNVIVHKCRVRFHGVVSLSKAG